MSQDSRRALWGGIETTEGTLPGFLRMQPFVDFKSDPKDARIRVKEYKNTRIRDGKAVRAKKSNEITMKQNMRYDLSGWELPSLMGSPVTALSTSTGANNVQTLTFGGTWTNGDLFRLTVNGYTTGNIVYNSTSGTLGANIGTQLALLPSVMSSATSGTVNCTVGALSAGNLPLTFGNNLVSSNIPLITGLVVASANATATITIANTTPGRGQYVSTMTGGGSGLPTLGFVYFDGVSFKQLLGASVESLDLTGTTDNLLQGDWKLLSRFEVDGLTGLTQTVVTGTNTIAGLGSQTQVVTNANASNIYVGKMLLVTDNDGTSNQEIVTVTAVSATSSNTTFTAVYSATHTTGGFPKYTPINLPTMVESAYNQPIDPTQMSFTVAGGAFTGIKDFKMSIKGNREPLHTLGGGVDMIRATEGEFNVDFEFTGRYTTYAGSQYKNYIDNVAPGALVWDCKDTATTIPVAGGSALNPDLIMTMNTVSYETGSLDSMRPETEQTIKGYSVLDTTNTNIVMALTNEQRFYGTLVA